MKIYPDVCLISNLNKTEKNVKLAYTGSAELGIRKARVRSFKLIFITAVYPY